MISQTSSSLVRSAYTNSFAETKDAKASSNVSKSEQSSKMSRVDQLKSDINSGEYKVNVDALANKMADDLL